MIEPNNVKEVNTGDDSIDLIAITKTLWNGRKIIIICLLIGMAFGLIVALSSSNQYTARTVLVPQIKTSSKSSLSNLAALAGVDLGMAESIDLSPLIYPQIVSSVPFNLELMNTPVHFQSQDHAVTLFDYYTKIKKPNIFAKISKYTIGLPGVILSLIPAKQNVVKLPKSFVQDPLQMSKKQMVIKKMLDRNMHLSVEKKEGYLTLTVTAEDPVVAAELTKKAQQMLQKFITDFKLEKSIAELEFIQERYNVAKSEAESYQYNVASNLDKYKNLTSNVPQVIGSRIQTKYNIANSVYLELAKQLEQAKIQVKRDTPVFTVVEPVSIPLEKSSSSRIKILVMWMFLGFIMGAGLIFGKFWLSKIRAQWQNT